MDVPVRVIFFTRRGALQAASVDLDPEPALDRSEPFRHGHLPHPGAAIGIEGEYLVRELVSAFWATLTR
jgi:hypothetical protein